MTKMMPGAQVLLLAVALLALSGCPQPQLSLTPRALDFGNTSVTRVFTVFNSGGGVLDWSVEEVARANADAPWVTQDLPWLAVDPVSGSATTETDRVTLTADRSGQPVGVYNNTGVRVVSSAGAEVIPVAMTISPTLLVAPTLFTLAGTTLSTSFTVQNTGATAASWQVLYVPDPGAPAETQPLPPGITAAPASGSTAPAAQTAVTVSWPEGQDDFYLLVESAAGSHLLTFKFGAQLQGLEVTPSPLTLYVDAQSVDAEEAVP